MRRWWSFLLLTSLRAVHSSATCPEDYVEVLDHDSKIDECVGLHADEPITGNQHTVALILRLTGHGKTLGDQWTAVSCAAVLAIAHSNQRDGRVVPEFATQAGEAILNMTVFDSMSDQRGSLSAYREANRYHRISAIVGPARSASATVLSELCAVDYIPLISYWASAPELSSQRYQYFSRSFPTDGDTAETALRVMQSFGWKYISLIHTNDVYGIGYRQVMGLHHSKYDIEIHRSISYEFGVVESMDKAVQALASPSIANGQGNIFFFIGFDADVEPIMDAAWELGIVGPGYAWIGSDGITSNAISMASQPERLAHRMSGFLAYQLSPRFSDGFKRLSALWPSLTPADCANPLFETPARVFHQPPPELAAFAYDAAAAAALALRAVSADSTCMRVRALEAVRTSDFSGASGRVRFKNSTGDRSAYDLEWLVYNWVQGADGAIQVRPAVRGSVYGPTTEALTEIQWLGGMISKPGDAIHTRLEAERRSQETAKRSLVIAVSFIVGLLSIAFVYIVKFYIKSAERTRKILKSHRKATHQRLLDALATTQELRRHPHPIPIPTRRHPTTSTPPQPHFNPTLPHLPHPPRLIPSHPTSHPISILRFTLSSHPLRFLRRR